MNERLVLIGIQARSTSKRLPNKINMKICGKTVLEHILFNCEHAVRYLQKDKEYFNCQVKICALMPKDDPAVAMYKSAVQIIEGDENDVLSRYVQAAREHNPTYIVRITADCIFLPTHLIAKHIKSALVKARDYTTNIHYRTYKEGFDCEVLSRRLLDWLDINAANEFDREHVTTLIAKDKLFPFQDSKGNKNICHIINSIDESEMKTSIDTLEEFNKAKDLFERLAEAKRQAMRHGIFHT